MDNPHDPATTLGAPANPVACRLTRADLARQADRWERLFGRALVSRRETADGLLVAFRAEPGLHDELRHLVEIENECCPWADWSVEANSGQLALAVRSTGDGVATLHGMFNHPGPDQG